MLTADSFCPEEPCITWGPESQISRGNGQFWGLSGPLRSIVSHCCGVHCKKINNGNCCSWRWSRPVDVTLTFVKNLPPGDVVSCQNFFIYLIWTWLFLSMALYSWRCLVQDDWWGLIMIDRVRWF